MRKLLLATAFLLSLTQISNAQKIMPYPATCVFNDEADAYILGMLEDNTIIQNTIQKNPGEKVKLIEMYTMYNFDKNFTHFVLYTEEVSGDRSACLMFMGESIFAGKK